MQIINLFIGSLIFITAPRSIKTNLYYKILGYSLPKIMVFIVYYINLQSCCDGNSCALIFILLYHPLQFV